MTCPCQGLTRNVHIPVRGPPAPTQIMRGHIGLVSSATAFFKDIRRVVVGSRERSRDVQKGALVGRSCARHIQRVIDAKLANAPLRVLDTHTGRLCTREAQISTFIDSVEYEKLLYVSIMYPSLRTVATKQVVASFFSWVMLSHRWESGELLLHDIQDEVVYELNPVGTVGKVQMFCKVARNAGYRWAWVDTCCIDQNNNFEVQRSVNSMFVWYRHSALTIVYMSDVPPSSMSGALASSAWNTRGWTIQEFLASLVVLFYRADWSLYLDDHSPNHKESVTIMQELEYSTGINARALIAFHPGMTDAREKLQWASTRVTTLEEDIAYSLFGIFRIHLPILYGETKQNALGRLLQEIVARSGDTVVLDWVGKSSAFNSCLPADIISYKAPPCTLPSLSEDEMQTCVCTLRNNVAMESALKLYTLLDNLSAPRFANSRLQLPCIAFRVTEVRRSRGEDQDTCFTYYVKADGLKDMQITTKARLSQFSSARPTQQTFLLVRPWNRCNLGLPDFVNDKIRTTRPSPGSPSPSDQCSEVDSMSPAWSQSPEPSASVHLPGNPHAPVNLEANEGALRLIVRLGQPFGALFLSQQRGLEYKRIASDHNIIAQVKNMASIDDMLNIRTLEIL